MRRALQVAVLSSFCVITMLLMTVPKSSPKAGYYDPWIDLNDDGKIDMRDVAMVARAYGSLGEPITKASLVYDSGWVNITERAGEHVSVTHNLGITDWGSMDVAIDIVGRTALDDDGILRLRCDGPDWYRMYGGTEREEAFSAVHTGDGGYAIAGYTRSYGEGGEDFWLVKTDKPGNTQWSKTYGGPHEERAETMVQTSDGGYALAGYSYNPYAWSTDCLLIKTDKYGNMQWNRTYSKDAHSEVSDVVETKDGGYALACTYSDGEHYTGSWLIKVDSIGKVEWDNVYSGKGGGIDMVCCIVETNDGGYALAGTTGTLYGEDEFWLIKTNSLGIEEWNEMYGGASTGRAYSVVQTDDGGYAIAGDGFANLVKTDDSGSLQWNRTYGGKARSLIQTGDGGYILAGCTRILFGYEEDLWLVRADIAGNHLWTRIYGGTGFDGARSIVETSDRWIAVAGWTSSFGAGKGDFWLLRPDGQSGLSWVDSTANTITLYRSSTDAYWNYVRVRILKVKETP